MPAVDRPPLTRTRILDAAIQLADAEGVAAVTMRRVASVLGVEAMSLYNHVQNKQDLLDGMTALLLSRMQPVSSTEPMTWQQVLIDMCWAYRRLMGEHPHVFASAGGGPRLFGDDQPALVRVTSALREAGFSDEAALDIFFIGSSYTRGFTQSAIAYQNAVNPSPGDWDADRAFQRGITALVAGFDTHPRP